VGEEVCNLDTFNSLLTGACLYAWLRRRSIWGRRSTDGPKMMCRWV